MHPEIINIGGFPIKYYSLMYILAFAIGSELGKKNAKKYKISPDLVDKLATWVMVSGILGARIYYIIAAWDYYKDNLYEVIAIWKGISGLAIHGGIIGALIGIIAFSKVYKVSVWELIDIAASPTLLGQALGRIGNFMNGEAHGVPTFTPLNVILKGNFEEWWAKYNQEINTNFKEVVPWGIVFPAGSPAGEQFPNMPVHPTMLYEMVLNLIGFLLLYFYFGKKNYKSGTIGGIYAIMYAIIRSLVTLFRADDLFLFGIRLPMLFNGILIAIGAFILYFRNKKEQVEY